MGPEKFVAAVATQVKRQALSLDGEIGTGISYFCAMMLSRMLSLIGLLIVMVVTSASAQSHLFFLHNRFIEEHDLDEDHPVYGNPHYRDILAAFRKKGFIVHSEKRPSGTDVQQYARGIAAEVDSLIGIGVPAGKITVIGTSKGGYIAQYVSTYLANPDVNFVFIGCYQDADLQRPDGIEWCGNILTIYEASDSYGVSALDRKLTSPLPVTHFREIELHTGLEHGFLFRPLDEWIGPAARWAQQRYSEVGTQGMPCPVRMDTLVWHDGARSRDIPVAVYRPERAMDGRGVVIFSHGYWANQPGAYRAYGYLTEFLATQGYFVVSVQHELPTDSLIPAEGIPQVVRRPFWERGADNIQFVIDELRRSHPTLDFRQIALIGHSNGGDMVALFPQKYPGVAQKIITLDNRRMPLPRADRLAVLSLRSSDQEADFGVLPTGNEQATLQIQITKLADTQHDEMDDSADGRQRREIREHILAFLKN